MEPEIAVTSNLGSLEYAEVALKAFLGRNDENVHEGIKKLQRQIEEFKKPPADEIRSLVLEPTAPVVSPHNETYYEVGNNSGFDASASKSVTEASSSLRRKRNVDEEFNISGSKRQKRKLGPIGIAQRATCTNQYSQLSSRPVIVLAPVKSFNRVYYEALAEASRNKKGTLDSESSKALPGCVRFWGRVLGKEGQQKYLDFLKLVKSVKQWTQAKESQCVMDDMMKRHDPEIIQDVVRSYMLQDSTKNLFGIGKFNRMVHLAEFHQHYQALVADVSLRSGEVRKFFKAKGIRSTKDYSWHNIVKDYMVYCLLRMDLKEFFQDMTMDDQSSIDSYHQINSNHSRGLDEFKLMIEVSSSFSALKAKFGSGIFVFILDREIEMFRKATRKILSYVIDALAQFIPDILIICQQVTSRLMEPLMRGEIPKDLKSSLFIEGRSLSQLVTATTQDLTFYTVDQIENEGADERQTSSNANQ